MAIQDSVKAMDPGKGDEQSFDHESVDGDEDSTMTTDGDPDYESMPIDELRETYTLNLSTSRATSLSLSCHATSPTIAKVRGIESEATTGTASVIGSALSRLGWATPTSRRSEKQDKVSAADKKGLKGDAPRKPSCLARFCRRISP